MSIKLMSKIWDHPELARGKKIVTKGNKEVDQQNKLRTLKMVLLALADMANDDGVCWPSNKTIAERSNLTTDYVRSLIGTLKANGWLSTEERFSSTGKQTSNVITLNTAKIHRTSAPDLLHPSHLVGGTPLDLVGGTIEPSTEPQKRNINDRSTADSQWTSAIASKLESVGVGLSPYILDEYMELAKENGIEAVIRGITAAAQNNKQHRFPYVKTCIRNIAQGDERPGPKETMVKVAMSVTGSRGEVYEQVVTMPLAKAQAQGYKIIEGT